MTLFRASLVAQNLPAKTGDTGSIPYSGRLQTLAPKLLSLCSRSRELQLLSPHTATTEARALESVAPQEKPKRSENNPARAIQLEQTS